MEDFSSFYPDNCRDGKSLPYICPMNLEQFIAKRVASGKERSFSGLIIRIAVVAIALSLAVMIVSTAVISGFKNQIGEKIFGFWGHIHVTGISVNQTTGETVPIDKKQPFYPSILQTGQIEFLQERTILGIETGSTVLKRTEGGIRHIQVFALKPGILKTKKELEGIVLKGIGQDFDSTFFKRYLVEGQAFNQLDSAGNETIILSKQTATRLGLKIGDKVIFNFVQESEPLKKRFTVKGFYKTGLEEYDRKFALVDIRRLQEILGWEGNQVGGFEIFIDDLDDLHIFNKYIYEEVLTGELISESIDNKFPAIFEWLNLQNINDVVVRVLMLIVGLINMVTALMILILERTNMIGTLKALGQTNWSIRKVFLYHAGYIILTGLFFGNLTGILFCWLQQRFSLIKLSEENYYLSEVPVEWNLWTLLALNLGTLLVTLLFLILPSWLVSRISPVKAIRFK